MPGNNIGKNSLISGRGYTLVEIIVVLAIFSVLVLIITDVFMMALKSQQQTAKRQEISSSIRNLVETIARQVRVSEINYGKYGLDGVETEETDLYLRDQTGRLIHYSYDENGGLGRILVDFDDTVAYQLTDPNAIRVLVLKFFISPSRNPFLVETCAGRPNTNNGCLNTNNNWCTVQSADAPKTGYCGCTQDLDCASGLCDTTTYYNNLFNQYSCETPPCNNNNNNGGICLPQNTQPRVTIVIGLESRGGKAEDIKDIYLQTTVSSRVYKR